MKQKEMSLATKKELAAALKRQMARKPINKITVRELVAECGINRNSFYYHFADLPTLVETILKEDADQLIQKAGAISSLEECLGLAIDFTLKNKRAVLHIYSSVNRAHFEHYLDRVCTYAVTRFINTAAGNIPIQEEDRKLIIQYFKCLLTGYILNWMADGLRYDIRSQVSRLCTLFDGSISQAFNKSAGKAENETL